MPRPPANLALYVEALGPELAVSFLLAYGGAELSLALDPKGSASHFALFGYEKSKALAAHAGLTQRRVPLGNHWLAAMLHWQGYSTASICRKLRSSSTSVHRWLKEWDK